MLAAGAAWWFFPHAHNPAIPQPKAATGIPLEIHPVEIHRAWLDRQHALLAGARNRLPIEAAMACVVAAGTLNPGHAP